MERSELGCPIAARLGRGVQGGREVGVVADAVALRDARLEVEGVGVEDSGVARLLQEDLERDLALFGRLVAREIEQVGFRFRPESQGECQREHEGRCRQGREEPELEAQRAPRGGVELPVERAREEQRPRAEEELLVVARRGCAPGGGEDSGPEGAGGEQLPPVVAERRVPGREVCERKEEEEEEEEEEEGVFFFVGGRKWRRREKVSGREREKRKREKKERKKERQKRR